MNKILFHPQIGAAEAQRIAAGQGGRLVYRCNRQHILMAQGEVDRSVAAIDAGDFDAALASLRTAHQALFGGSVMEVQP